MRLSTFNVENLFQRPAAMNLEDWTQGSQVLADHARLNHLLGEAVYTDALKSELRSILDRYPALTSSGRDPLLVLREVRGKLLKRPKSGGYEIVPSGHGDWVGWFELAPALIDEAALLNTGRVLKEIAADVQCVIEVEDRIALKRFNDEILPQIGGTPFAHAMVIDGNDARGIDVGLLMRDGYALSTIRSHVDDRPGLGKDPIFSRDCPEYDIVLPSGQSVLVLINHFKSKGYGDQGQSDAKRLSQAQRVREIYDQRRAEGVETIAIVGDFNDTPDGVPMAPLLGDGSDLKDVSTHPSYISDGRPGTYGNGTASGKIDYILLSPALFSRVNAAGVERRGVWGGKNGTLFPHFPEITTAPEAASDHAALWVELAP